MAALMPAVGVGDDQLDTGQAPGHQAPQNSVQAAVSSALTMSKPTISVGPDG